MAHVWLVTWMLMQGAWAAEAPPKCRWPEATRLEVRARYGRVRINDHTRRLMWGAGKEFRRDLRDCDYEMSVVWLNRWRVSKAILYTNVAACIVLVPAVLLPVTGGMTLHRRTRFEQALTEHE